MAMGRRKDERQQDLFICPADLPQSVGHPFYQKLNRLLAEAGFDAFVEKACESFYEAKGPGRPGIPPGVYFRMLFVGYFEGIDSQRGIAWRISDSLSLREFLGTPLTETTPDHSTLTRIRGRLPQEVHDKVFQFVLKLAEDKKLLTVSAVGIDSTMIEADAVRPRTVLGRPPDSRASSVATAARTTTRS